MDNYLFQILNNLSITLADSITDSILAEVDENNTLDEVLQLVDDRMSAYYNRELWDEIENYACKSVYVARGIVISLISNWGWTDFTAVKHKTKINDIYDLAIAGLHYWLFVLNYSKELETKTNARVSMKLSKELGL